MYKVTWFKRCKKEIFYLQCHLQLGRFCGTLAQKRWLGVKFVPATKLQVGPLFPRSQTGRICIRNSSLMWTLKHNCEFDAKWSQDTILFKSHYLELEWFLSGFCPTWTLMCETALSIRVGWVSWKHDNFPSLVILQSSHFKTSATTRGQTPLDRRDKTISKHVQDSAVMGPQKIWLVVNKRLESENT